MYTLKRIVSILLVIIGIFSLVFGIIMLFHNTALKAILISFGIGLVILFAGVSLRKQAEDSLPKDETIFNEGNIYINNFSDYWVEVFTLIDRAGGVKLPNIKDLSRKQRMKVNVNVPAFFFGAIYYLIKGMWRPMLTYLFLMILFIQAYDYVLLNFFEKESSVGPGALFSFIWSMLANKNYYKMHVLGEKNWI